MAGRMTAALFFGFRPEKQLTVPQATNNNAHPLQRVANEYQIYKTITENHTVSSDFFRADNVKNSCL